MSLFNGQGYLINDDTASGGTKDEADILGCRHCQALLKKADWQKAGGMCFVCAGPLCYSCQKRSALLGCEGPFEKKIEAAVNDHYRITQNARVLGI